MAIEYVLLITGQQDFISRGSIECTGRSLCDHAVQRNGSGWAGWLPSGVLKVRIHGMAVDEIRRIIGYYLEAAEKTAYSMSVVEQQVEASPLPNIEAGEIPWGTVSRKKLTKKLLNILPEVPISFPIHTTISKRFCRKN